MVFSLDELVDFILKAREYGYAGSAEKISNPQRPGFKEFAPFRKGDFEYVDSYAGHYYAPGQEVVRFQDKPVWNMSYNGGMFPEHHGDLEFSKKTFTFLKKALLKVDKKRPFRGPNKLEEGDFVYLDESEGDTTNFKGTERILYRGREVFKQDYIGGLIVRK